LWGEALRQATWLKNRTATRALDGKTPFEALYGRPSDLSALHTWGTPVLVHNTSGSKLNVRAREARWLGLDVDVKAHRVYWPGMGNVTVERNVYFGTSAQLEREEEDSPGAGIKQAADPTTPTSSTPIDSSDQLDPPSLTEIDDDEDEDEPEPEPEQPKAPALRRSSRLWKPSRILWDLQSGEGVTSTRSAPPQSVPPPQIEEVPDEELEEAGGVWAVADGEPTLLENFEGLVNVFMAETTDSEALEPQTLAEARRRPDWLQWEQAILEELATLKAAGTWVLEEAPPGANIIGSKCTSGDPNFVPIRLNSSS
jgi:hypothetical protein